MVRAGAPNAPVLLVLDPMLILDLTIGIANQLHLASSVVGGHFPDLTIVGLGYATPDFDTTWAARMRDLSPTDGTSNTLLALPPFAFGGGPRFLEAIETEVIPRVAARLETDAAPWSIAGISFGGLFALYTLFHRPDLFSGYVVGSPSLWWEDGIASKWEAAWAETHSDLRAKVFLGNGECEQVACDPGPQGAWRNEGFSNDQLGSLGMVDRLRALEAQLRSRAYPSLRLSSTVFAGDYHLTAPAAIVTRGLLHLFDSE
jgi:pimeloyl-ACP methyl ester carboxylesterase